MSDPAIRNIYRLPNGLTAAFDWQGQQLPRYQDAWPAVRPLLAEVLSARELALLDQGIVVDRRLPSFYEEEDAR